MRKNIINLDEIEFQARPAIMGTPPDKYDATMAWVAPQIGAKLLGYSVTKIAPGGNRAFPFHSHRVNEEMFFILEGTGTLRAGDTEEPVRKGDFIACPSGGPETAHQLVNTGEGDLTYIGVSTQLSPEIADYPDSGKFGILANFGVDENGQPKRFMYLGKEGEGIKDYWEGEK